ncbi:hypothetical protein Rpal_0051 [Rhodopseudomonas palustris TIE-1]|nr:hypothetical protein Rpal_0051 [Rhodopseudomonas palustris TIE-1]
MITVAGLVVRRDQHYRDTAKTSRPKGVRLYSKFPIRQGVYNRSGKA